MKGVTVLTGVLTTLSSLFKHGKREEMVEYAPTILKHLAKCDFSNSDNTLLRKLNIKLAQVKKKQKTNYSHSHFLWHLYHILSLSIFVFRDLV